MGTGLASRFSLALSRVIDNTATTADAHAEDDEEMQEIILLIDEMNQH